MKAIPGLSWVRPVTCMSRPLTNGLVLAPDTVLSALAAARRPVLHSKINLGSVAPGHDTGSRVNSHMSGPYRARFALGLLASKIRALLYPGVKIQLQSRRGESAARPAGGREASPLAADDNLSLAFLSAGDERASGQYQEDPHAPADGRPGPRQARRGPPGTAAITFWRPNGHSSDPPAGRAPGHLTVQRAVAESLAGRMTGRSRCERDGRDQRGASSRAWSRNDRCRLVACRPPDETGRAQAERSP